MIDPWIQSQTPTSTARASLSSCGHRRAHLARCDDVRAAPDGGHDDGWVRVGDEGDDEVVCGDGRADSERRGHVKGLGAQYCAQ
jgi:hypothetical protein